MQFRYDILIGDLREKLRELPAGSVHCCISSPPYWGLRDYKESDQIGLERTPEEYVSTMVEVFRGVWRVLRQDGTLWLNLGDSYAGNGSGGGQGKTGQWANRTHTQAPLLDKIGGNLKPKDLCGIPWRVALALQADGWTLRRDVIWHKPNPMPESCKDRPVTGHEYVFLMTKGKNYFYDSEAVRERASYAGDERHLRADRSKEEGGPRQDDGSRKRTGSATFGRNLRSVWTIPTQPFGGDHFAAFPERLVSPMVRASTSAAGCCRKCGQQWERVIEAERVPTRPGDRSKVKIPQGWDTTKGSGGHGTIMKDRAEIGNRDPRRHHTQRRTIGWQLRCGHVCNPIEGELEAAPRAVPATVLDPFCGTGTVGAVCRHFGRRFIGIELNPDYAALARRRIEDLPAELESDAGDDGQLDLFAAGVGDDL